MVRWPGKIAAGAVSNGIVSTTTGFRRSFPPRVNPTSSASSSRATPPATRPTTCTSTATITAVSTGEVDKSPRRGLIYFSDDCDVLGIRYENWKLVFLEQRCPGTLQVWAEPFTHSGHRSCSTCGPIRSSGPTSPPTPTGTGSWIIRFWRCTEWPSSPNSSTRSRNSRRAQEPATFTITDAVQRLNKFLESRGG